MHDIQNYSTFNFNPYATGEKDLIYFLVIEQAATVRCTIFLQFTRYFCCCDHMSVSKCIDFIKPKLKKGKVSLINNVLLHSGKVKLL